VAHFVDVHPIAYIRRCRCMSTLLECQKSRNERPFFWRLTGLTIHHHICASRSQESRSGVNLLLQYDFFFSSFLMIPGRRGVDKRSTEPEKRQFWNSTFRSPPAQAQMSQLGDTSFGVCTWKIYSGVRRRW
jgi:hypothetical protein